jgi:hypothetical protein
MVTWRSDRTESIAAFSGNYHVYRLADTSSGSHGSFKAPSRYRRIWIDMSIGTRVVRNL